MSRCIACDANLNDFESTRKLVYDDGHVHYPDLCNTCFKESGIGKVANVVERQDLNHYDEIDDESYPDEDGEYQYDKAVN
jgi:hypothetical protein